MVLNYVSAEVSQFAAAAQQSGVMVINGSDGDFYLNASQNSNAFIASALGILGTIWNGANPKPFAFSVADEPPAADAKQLASYVLQAQAANLPVTTVLAPGTVSTILGARQNAALGLVRSVSLFRRSRRRGRPEIVPTPIFSTWRRISGRRTTRQPASLGDGPGVPGSRRRLLD